MALWLVGSDAPDGIRMRCGLGTDSLGAAWCKMFGSIMVKRLWRCYFYFIIEMVLSTAKFSRQFSGTVVYDNSEARMEEWLKVPAMISISATGWRYKVNWVNILVTWRCWCRSIYRDEVKNDVDISHGRSSKKSWWHSRSGELWNYCWNSQSIKVKKLVWSW